MHAPHIVAALITVNGGVCSLQTLAEAGILRDDVTAALAAGVVTRVRRGWYATADAHDDAVRAVRVGGTATAATVVRGFDLPVADDGTLHVRVGQNASRLRSPDLHTEGVAAAARGLAADGISHAGVFSHADVPPHAGVSRDGRRPLDRTRDRVCVHYRTPPPATGACDPLHIALAEMLVCADPGDAITTLDAALARGILSARDLAVVRSWTRPSDRWIVDRASAGSQSVIESKVRMLLRSRRIPHRTQVQLHGVGRVDVLVGDRLVIEVDGSEFHSGADAFESDRRRDFEFAVRGYLVIRLSYRMVMSHWDATSAELLALIARGEHRWGYRAREVEHDRLVLPRHVARGTRQGEAGSR